LKADDLDNVTDLCAPTQTRRDSGFLKRSLFITITITITSIVPTVKLHNGAVKDRVIPSIIDILPTIAGFQFRPCDAIKFPHGH